MHKGRTSGQGQRARNAGCASSSRSVCSAQTKRGSLARAVSAPQPKTGSAGQRASCIAKAAPAVAAPQKLQDQAAEANGKPLRVIIAGAGIGGLVLAVGLLKRGFEVKVLERDVTAIRGEGKYRGPIQVQSNALAALEAIDSQVAKRVFEEGCITGDRINGLVDGVSGKWYVKFDTYHPAVERGLPVTRVISRVTLQQILAAACHEIAGEDLIDNGTNVVGYEERKDPVTGKKTVTAISEDGRRFEGDILIGADGIHSKVRGQLLGPSSPTYSEYTCYTGIADFTPPDIDTVGYRVFLGNGKYFVSSDVGGGKMQWYGFHKESRGGSDPPGAKKERLLQIFGHWTDMVTDLIKATPEVDVLRRDIFDRPPILKWTDGRVVLLGDSAHAMQPNLGQGGCMAIEDGYQLAKDLGRDAELCRMKGMAYDPEVTLKKYQGKRVLRASTIHGLAGMAAIMASTYKAYLGEGLGPLSWIQRFKIPHPGRVGGYVAMNLTMPSVLAWVLGGNVKAFEGSDRKPYCQLSEKPKSFCEADFGKFLRDDSALLRAAKARWLLVPAIAETADQDVSRRVDDAAAAQHDSERHERAYLRIALPSSAIHIDDEDVVIGSESSCTVPIESSWVSPKHAVVARSGEDYFLTDLGSEHGTFLNDRKIRPNKPAQVRPGDVINFGKTNSIQQTFKVKMCHISVFEHLAGMPSDATAKIPQPA